VVALTQKAVLFPLVTVGSVIHVSIRLNEMEVGELAYPLKDVTATVRHSEVRLLAPEPHGHTEAGAPQLRAIRGDLEFCHNRRCVRRGH
jgi:hypothetical protein